MFALIDFGHLSLVDLKTEKDMLQNYLITSLHILINENRLTTPKLTVHILIDT